MVLIGTLVAILIVMLVDHHLKCNCRTDVGLRGANSFC